MPRNGTGTYELPLPDVVDGTTIDTTWANPTLHDLEDELTASIAADGQTPMSGPLKLYAGNAASPGLTFNAESNTGLFRASGVLGITIGGGEKARFDSSGNLSIGNTSANQKLDVTGGIRHGNGTEIGELTVSTGYVNVGARSASALSLITNNTERLRITSGGTIQDGAGLEIGYRVLPVVNSVTTAARGKQIVVSSGVTLPSATFAEGDSFLIYNHSSSSITVTQGSGLTLRFAGTSSTGNRTLQQRGVCQVVYLTASEAYISGAGLT